MLCVMLLWCLVEKYCLLKRIVERLEQEGCSSDPNVRAQIQEELVQVGLSMRQFGALLLELGRTILTFRMGQSPVSS